MPIESYVIACLSQGSWERALTVIEELGADPGYAPHFAAASSRLRAEKHLPSALNVALKAVDLDPTCLAAQRSLGLALLAIGDEAGGEGALRQALSLGDDAATRQALAGLLLRMGRANEAKPHVERALELSPADDAAWDLLRELRKATPKYDPASEELASLAGRAQGLKSKLKAPALSLCVITKNEASNLPRVIRSVRGLATEVIIVDTGSTDATVGIAKKLGAKVSQFDWIDDFAAARNRSLELATGEWVLVLDADDELAPGDADALRKWLMRGTEASVVGLYRSYPHPDLQRASVSIHPRLFRREGGYHFAGAIHEQVVNGDGYPVAPEVTVPIRMLHHGYDEGKAAGPARRKRNLRLLAQAVERDPFDLRSRFYLGLTCFEAGEWERSVAHFNAVIRAADETADFLAKAYACAGNALLKLERADEAEALLREGLTRRPEHPELWFCLGLTLTAAGRYHEAINAYQAALRGRFGASLNWHDWACRESKPHLALSELLLFLGRTDEAQRHLDTVIGFTRDAARYQPLQDAIRHAHLASSAAKTEAPTEQRELAESLLKQQRWSEAADAFLQALKERDDWPTWLGLGKAYLRSANLPGAIHCFQTAATLSHGAAEVRTALAEAKSYLLGAQSTSANTAPL